MWRSKKKELGFAKLHIELLADVMPVLASSVWDREQLTGCMREVYHTAPVVDRDGIDLKEINEGRQFQSLVLHAWTLQIAIKLQKVEGRR